MRLAALTDAIRSAAAFVLALPIRAYRYAISPLMPPSCRFDPTCSAYALEALQVHGPIKGTFLAMKRILRCHPIRFLGGSEGHDPVPSRNGTTADPTHRHLSRSPHAHLPTRKDTTIHE